jgi:hypothetical protein
MGQNKTFSYYASRSQSEVATGREALQNKPAIRRIPTRFQRLRAHAGWFMLGLAVIAVVIYELQLSTTPRVVALTPSSDAPFLQDSATYQREAQKLFEASAANRNKLTLNTTEITAMMRQKFPELEEVSILLPVLGSTPTMYVRPADPSLVLAATNGTFVVDEYGRALAELKNNASATQLGKLGVPTVTDQSSLSAKLGQQVLPSDATKFIATVMGQLKAKGVSVQSMTLPAAAGELDVYISGQAYFVKFNLQEGGAEVADVQAGTFLAVKHQLEQQGKQPSQYIDVRLDGRAYWK